MARYRNYSHWPSSKYTAEWFRNSYDNGLVGRKKGFRRGFGACDEIGAADDGGTGEGGELVISGGVGRNDAGVWHAVRNETGELIGIKCV
jgi:hypothetical protein